MIHRHGSGDMDGKLIKPDNIRLFDLTTLLCCLSAMILFLQGCQLSMVDSSDVVIADECDFTAQKSCADSAADANGLSVTNWSRETAELTVTVYDTAGKLESEKISRYSPLGELEMVYLRVFGDSGVSGDAIYDSAFTNGNLTRALDSVFWTRYSDTLIRVTVFNPDQVFLLNMDSVNGLSGVRPPQDTKVQLDLLLNKNSGELEALNSWVSFLDVNLKAVFIYRADSLITPDSIVLGAGAAYFYDSQGYRVTCGPLSEAACSDTLFTPQDNGGTSSSSRITRWDPVKREVIEIYLRGLWPTGYFRSVVGDDTKKDTTYWYSIYQTDTTVNGFAVYEYNSQGQLMQELQYDIQRTLSSENNNLFLQVDFYPDGVAKRRVEILDGSSYFVVENNIAGRKVKSYNYYTSHGLPVTGDTDTSFYYYQGDTLQVSTSRYRGSIITDSSVYNSLEQIILKQQYHPDGLTIKFMEEWVYGGDGMDLLELVQTAFDSNGVLTIRRWLNGSYQITHEQAGEGEPKLECAEPLSSNTCYPA